MKPHDNDWRHHDGNTKPRKEAEALENLRRSYDELDLANRKVGPVFMDTRGNLLSASSLGHVNHPWNVMRVEAKWSVLVESVLALGDGNRKSCGLEERVITLENQLEKRVSALDKQFQRVNALEQQLESRCQELQVRLCFLEGELALVTKNAPVSIDATRAVSSPLEDEARASPAAITSTPARNAAHDVVGGQQDRQKSCSSCQRSTGTLTVCDQCKERFCRSCQLWCSTLLGGCGARVCERCNKTVSRGMQISKWKGKWRCGHCFSNPR